MLRTCGRLKETARRKIRSKESGVMNNIVILSFRALARNPILRQGPAYRQAGISPPKT
jgi:hypothetical protein